MSSVLSGFAQPVTNNFKVDASGTIMWSGETPTLARENLLNVLDASQYVQVSRSVVLFDTALNLAAGATDLANTGTGSVVLTQYETLKDMGEQLYLGLQGDESALIAFRLVQRVNATPLDGVGNGAVGFVCVQNSLNDGTLSVKVSRV